MHPAEPHRRRPVFALLVAALGVALAAAAAIGEYNVFKADETAATILWNLRLPRALQAAGAGAALALAGAVLQGLFRNPLADPAIIGISTGAACGAVLAIVVLPGIPGGQTLLALGGATALTFLVYRLSQTGGRPRMDIMLLAGVAINAIGGAFIGVALTMLANTYQLREFVFWTLGSLAHASWPVAIVLTSAAVAGLLFAQRHARALNALLLGEAEAFQTGIDVPRVRRRLIVLCALLAGVTVAACGTIGFVGLVAPHIVRLLLGADHRRLLPAAALAGATLMVVADIAARTIVSPAELQIGIVTALAGGPFFLWLLIRRKPRL